MVSSFNTHNWSWQSIIILMTETSSQSEGLFDSIEVVAEEGIDTVDRSTSDTSIDSYVTRYIYVWVCVCACV